MFNYILLSIKGYKKEFLRNDVISGVVVAALTIPVSMGYAQVAGLPPIYGLYASFLPVLAYIIFASSPQLIYGIDATASAVTGSILLAAGIAAGSTEALIYAPLLAFFTGVFMLLFAALHLGRFASYISTPVMSGFISGISISIIVGQIPKIMGVSGGGSDFFANISAIFTQLGGINWISLVMGIIAAAIILVAKKFFRKIPVALIILVLGTAITAFFRLDQYGVVIVGEIPQGLPAFSLPDFAAIDNWTFVILGGLVSAIACFAGSLLPSKSFAMRNKYTVDDNREIFAYGVANIAAAISGTAPTSASVSRTAANEQFRGKTQVVSIVAAGVIAFVLLFLSGLLYYMPQPVLSAIVLAALVGVIDIDVSIALFRHTKREATIWLVSLLGVLLVGVLFGVMVGIVLSFLVIIANVVSSQSAELGVIPEREGYFDMHRHDDAQAIEGVVIYRYSSPLVFANINTFINGLDRATKKDNPKVVIIDASAITHIDVTAADTIRDLLSHYQEQHIQYYFANTIGRFRDDLRKNHVSNDIENHLTKTIDEALMRAEIEI
ncbi:SulP family inorganic anion transporter [Culicoidibacter larvae]|uniref:SulP family inorganic anion transporter n=1 Tax=Culicoidibacter larvae TaxID=2579976 RepID=A0A5R8QGY7_9FIRM|nr:SulP family inorganic anion transporter [Culicoidibacter larvae]TLG77258.1 SulP family inorganic anion transporter [Culicoidibacter larvae]